MGDKKMTTDLFPRLSETAINLLEARYLQPGESVDNMFWRVAKHVAKAERKYDPEREGEAAEQFFKMMRRLHFLPNSPTLMNAGTSLGQLSACFVVPIEDSLESILDAAKQGALIQKTGGGVGYDFSAIRPRDDLVNSTQKAASGPLPFIMAFDAITAAVNQGGRRRGANMAVLRVDHPDILDFIKAKITDGLLSNFNLSVAITDNFMKALKANRKFDLINPRTARVSGTLQAQELFDAIVHAAWASGEPGVLFIDQINRANPTPELGTIAATNPCGEQPLLPWESCNLGSINLAQVTDEKGQIDWLHLKKLTHLAVRFLEDALEVNRFPLPAIEQATLANRKIGLGVMGFVDLLVDLGIPYDSLEAVSIADRVMHFIQTEAHQASFGLGKARGSFPMFDRSALTNQWPAMRNATVTSIAPTGSLSLIAGCSSGIEPSVNLYGDLGLNGRPASHEGHPTFSWNSLQQPLMDHRAAHKISFHWHVKILAAFQAHVDNAISKTVNLPAEASKEKISQIFLSAYRACCKGITVYRDGCRRHQVRIEAKKVEDLYKRTPEAYTCQPCGD